MVSEDKKIVKLCDFGTGFPIEEVEVTDELVSRFYRAPEISERISEFWLRRR